jgi:hypothetical protein
VYRHCAIFVGREWLAEAFLSRPVRIELMVKELTRISSMFGWMKQGVAGFALTAATFGFAMLPGPSYATAITYDTRTAFLEANPTVSTDDLSGLSSIAGGGYTGQLSSANFPGSCRA